MHKSSRLRLARLLFANSELNIAPNAIKLALAGRVHVDPDAFAECRERRRDAASCKRSFEAGLLYTCVTTSCEANCDTPHACATSQASSSKRMARHALLRASERPKAACARGAKYPELESPVQGPLRGLDRPPWF